MNTEKKLNADSIIQQFELIKQSANSAMLPFETNMLDEKVLEVSLWELMKIREQAGNLIKEIGWPRFEPMKTSTIHYPSLDNKSALQLCDICGNPECSSDHK